jgi:AAA family ATP:ADP antiporter
MDGTVTANPPSTMPTDPVHADAAGSAQDLAAAGSDRRIAAAAFALFFCLLGGYFAVRPVRETVGTVLGAERVTDLWTVVWIVSLAVVPAYGWLVARVPRRTLLPWLYGGIAGLFATIGVAFAGGAAAGPLGAVFYVGVSVINLFIVSVFWSFLLEVLDETRRRRLFGVIAAGGTSGAIAGPLATDLFATRIGEAGVLFLGAGLFVAAVACQQWLLRQVPPRVDGTRAGIDAALGGSPFAGFGMVLRSPVLLGIALFVVLASTVNTFLYFEQLALVSAAFDDTTERTRWFARIDWIVQALAVFAQLFITGRVALRLGVVALLAAVPLAMVGGFAALAMAGGLSTLAVVMVLRRAGEFAFVRIGRELAFGGFDDATRYKAKNVIDVPVYRGADALAAQVQQALRGSGAETVAWTGVGVAAIWGVVGWLVGRRHDRGTGSDR